MANSAGPNRLAEEKSPYLLQHARNPVEWYPWGEEAFAKARRENKPIFLSIGYSTCHWCHVMAHESFENAETAAIMNREFVNIKVDREERPDVDRVYMTFVQATTGHGGWPMSVWLSPGLEPFVGGTYFPPEERYGQPGFPNVLAKIAAAWKQDSRKIAGSGAQIVEALREGQNTPRDPGGAIDPAVLDIAMEHFSSNYDSAEGGFGGSPKFPHPVTLNFLARYYARNLQSEKGKRALEMHTFTLRKMAAGGMHDHLGGGFHRYSVDRFWHVPHFEKMLYDQAQLAMAYLEAFQITRNPNFEKVVRDILGYVMRDMTASDGGFFSAEDADSLEEADKMESHREGAFYVWAKEEIDRALGDDSEVFNFHYGVDVSGNAPAGADPHGEFTGKNILIQRHTVRHTAAHFKRDEKAVEELLWRSGEKLLTIRAGRPRPHLDDKIIAAWNGLMISAFGRAAAVLGDKDYLKAATRAAEFVMRELYDGKVLYRSFRDGRGKVEGFADDYAFIIQGLLDLYEGSFDVKWMKHVVELQEAQDGLFLDASSGGYFSTSGKDKNVFLRMKDENDGAEPAPSSVAALNLGRLGAMLDRGDYRERAEKTVSAFHATLARFPSAMPQMLVALDFQLRPPRQIVIAGKKEDADARALASEARSSFIPNKVLLFADGGDAQEFFGERSEAIRAMGPVGGKAAAYVCENFTCQAPVTDAKALRAMLL